MTGAKRSCTEVGGLEKVFASAEVCGQDFIGFAPSGSAFLTLTGDSRHLIVRNLRTGARTREIVADQTIRAAGWEDENTLLYSTFSDGQARTYRCRVSTGQCRVIVTDSPRGSVLSPLPLFGL